MVKGKLLAGLIIVGLLVVYASFTMEYVKQRKGHEALISQITDVTQTLALITEPPPDLEQRLADIQASLAEEQGVFPNEINSTEVINTILSLADDCGVKAIPVVTEPWSIENVGQHSYGVFRLAVTVEGRLPQLVSLVNKLENGKFKTLIIKNLSVTRVSKPSGEETVSGEEMTVVATLGLAIYTQYLASD